MLRLINIPSTCTYYIHTYIHTAVGIISDTFI
jgi:hypothetical protein